MNEITEGSQGSRIDLHSHLLPGIDDGCKSLSDSLACIERLRKQGFRGTVCTPHILPTIYPHNTPANVAEEVARLRATLRERGIEYELWTGGEVRLAAETINWFETMGVPTLGDSSCVLVDYWGKTWPTFADRTLDYLQERDYQPILAHPERLDLNDQALLKITAEMARRGVWLQGNFNCITGNEGPAALALVRRLLEDDAYFVLALDMHGPDSLETRLRGVELLDKILGKSKLALLLEERPMTILQTQTVSQHG